MDGKLKRCTIKFLIFFFFFHFVLLHSGILNAVMKTKKLKKAMRCGLCHLYFLAKKESSGDMHGSRPLLQRLFDFGLVPLILGLACHAKFMYNM